jgi:hypothetical protein
MSGNSVRFRSSHRVHGTRLGYEFTATFDGGKLTGSVAMGEYGVAPFTAERHKYQQMGRRQG